MRAGEVLVEAALDPATGEFTDWCLSSHSEYATWTKQMIKAGREIHTKTIEEMCDWIHENPLQKS